MTVSSAFPPIPLSLMETARMVALPGVTPVTVPVVGSTVAIPVCRLCQVTPAVGRTTPLTSLTVAMKGVALAPTWTESADGDTVTEPTAGAPSTVKYSDPATGPDLTVMYVAPGPTAVTVAVLAPVDLTVAEVFWLLDQEKSPEQEAMGKRVETPRVSPTVILGNNGS